MVVEALKGTGIEMGEDAPGAGYFTILDATQPDSALVRVPTVMWHQDNRAIKFQEILDAHQLPILPIRVGVRGPCKVFVDRTFFSGPITFEHTVIARTYMGRSDVPCEQDFSHTEVYKPRSGHIEATIRYYGLLTGEYKGQFQLNISGTGIKGQEINTTIAFVNPQK